MTDKNTSSTSFSLIDVLVDAFGIVNVDPSLPSPSSSSSDSHASPTPPGNPPLSKSLSEVVNLISSGKCKNIVVLTGAGISVAAGIPDFRSKGTGLYDNLQKYNLPRPEAVFDISYFRSNPKPFFALAKELYPGQFNATKCHWFIRLLHEKGLLLRNYTQNIDTLELSASIPEDKIVFAHGSFASSTCTSSLSCGKVYSKEWMRDEIFEDRVPKCTKCGNTVKPDIVFFGENLPLRYFEMSRLDLPKADLLIIMGTSLSVFPFAGLASRVSRGVPRVLVNLEDVKTTRFDFDGDNRRDIPLIGDCQDTIDSLVSALGWDEEFQALMSPIVVAPTEK